MKRSWVLLIIAVNLAVLITLAFAYPHLMVSPGPLIPAHANLTTNCFACHAPLRGAEPARCIACHALADIGLRTTKGQPVSPTPTKFPFHQALTSQSCLSCHSDHSASGFSAVKQAKFSHALLNPAMSANCSSCHTAPNNAIHQDLKGTCSQCHSQERWKPATFDHAKFFVLDGDHNAACTTCHVNNDFSRYTCFGCHEHQPDGIRAKHLDEGIRNFENCVSCHRSAHGEAGEGGSENGGDDD
jgi:hypothetical protein